MVAKAPQAPAEALSDYLDDFGTLTRYDSPAQSPQNRRAEEQLPSPPWQPRGDART